MWAQFNFLVFYNFSSENRFVAGTKGGSVAIYNNNTVEKKIKLFTNSDQEKNATLVQYVDGRIYAVAEDSSLTQLNMNLRIEKVLGHKIQWKSYCLVATRDYVAVGGENKKVTVYDKTGRCLLVSYILLISLLF